MPPIRIGILGAAKIAPAAIVRPARASEEAEVVAIAARDQPRAAAFASKHGIRRVVPTYQQLVEDPDVDAVYNPLPNGLHGKWTLAAMAAGKHVLCEKPFTANASEAVAVAEAAQRAGVVVMEAFHYRYHPAFGRVLQLIEDGSIGDVRRIETWLCFPLPFRRDIRWQLDLAGGATMDAGCYTIHMARHLAGAEPQVTSAHAKLRTPQVDRAMQVDMTFADGRTGRATCSMWSSNVLRVALRVTGDGGEVRVLNPTAPQAYHRIVVKGKGGRRVEHSTRRPTYSFQLDAFAAAVVRGVPPITGTADAIANMTVIDAAYRAAGLDVRQPTP
jgi:predicted dehydrogenase